MLNSSWQKSIYLLTLCLGIGDSDGFRSHYLQRDRLALSRLSYRAKYVDWLELPSSFLSSCQSSTLARISPVSCRSLLPWETTGSIWLSCSRLVGVTGLEPARDFSHKHLKLACLPIPPYPGKRCDLFMYWWSHQPPTAYDKFSDIEGRVNPVAGYLLSVVAWTNTQLTHGRGKFYFAFLYLDRRFPQATYHFSY